MNDRFTSDGTVHYLQTPQDEFGDHLHVALDNTAYFAPNRVTEFDESSKLKVTYLLPGSPDMNPVEECWRQFKRELGNRFQSIDELRTDALDALAEIPQS